MFSAHNINPNTLYLTWSKYYRGQTQTFHERKS